MFGVGSQEWKDFICRGRGRKKAQRIFKGVVKNECEISHTPDDVFPGEGEAEI